MGGLEEVGGGAADSDSARVRFLSRRARACKFEMRACAACVGFSLAPLIWLLLLRRPTHTTACVMNEWTREGGRV